MQCCAGSAPHVEFSVAQVMFVLPHTGHNSSPQVSPFVKPLIAQVALCKARHRKHSVYSSVAPVTIGKLNGWFRLEATAVSNLIGIVLVYHKILFCLWTRNPLTFQMAWLYIFINVVLHHETNFFSIEGAVS